MHHTLSLLSAFSDLLVLKVEERKKCMCFHMIKRRIVDS